MPTALVIDDTLTDRQIFTLCLQRGGLDVITANSGEEALEKITTSSPDVIILDVVLPEQSGFQVCRELKANTQTSKIPVVLCSVKNSEMDKVWGMRQGADAYIPKPIDQEELLNTVHQLIKR